MFDGHDVVFILGGGPSFDKSYLDRLRNRRLIAINRSIIEAPWCDVGLFLDMNVWDWYGDQIRLSPCRKISLHSIPGTDVERWNGSGKRGLEFNKPNTIRTGNSSGYSAMGLAVTLGARRIVLLGFDGQQENGRSHWHKEHPRLTGQRALQQIASEFGSLVQPLRDAGVEVWNASPDSAIHVFPKTTLENVFGDIWPPVSLHPARETPCGAHILVPVAAPWPGNDLLGAIEGSKAFTGGVLPEDRLPAISWSSRGPAAVTCGRRRAPWVVAENGALHHWTPGTVSLSFGDFNGGGLLPRRNGPRPGAKRALVDHLLAPAGGAPILVCGQMGGKDHHVTSPPSWSDDVIGELRKYTKRPIWFKPHPLRPTTPSRCRPNKTLDARTALEDVLPQVHAVVGWTTSALTVAAAHGRPTVCLGPRAWAAKVSTRSLDGIDDLLPPDRKEVQQMLDDLTWSNWRRDELGEAWRWLWTAPL